MQNDELPESHLRFRDLLEAAPDGIFEVNGSGEIVLLNAAAERQFGYARAELLGQKIEILVPDSLRQRHYSHRDNYLGHPATRPMGIGLELFARRKNGTEFPVEISLSPISASDGWRAMAIVRDISARKLAEAEIKAMYQRFTADMAASNKQLEQRNLEVERANRLKSEFLASMSHELRTPLHTIIGFGDLLKEELKGPLNEAQQRFVKHIQDDSRHLLELINDLLDLSRIEAGRLDLATRPFQVAEALGEVLAGLRPLAAIRQIAISEDAAGSLTLTADRVRFKEILYNLISNALKFTADAGTVHVECKERGRFLRCAVIDSGIGIPEAEQEAIFDKFYQLGPTTRGVREGTGLGLAITKRLVELHGGTISVRSTPGQGSCFTFELPLSATPPHPAASSPEDKITDRVLVISKNADYCERLSQILAAESIRSVCIAKGGSLEEAVRTSAPMAVIIEMSSLDSELWRTLQGLRIQVSAHAPLFVFTAIRDEDAGACLHASAILQKPVEPSHLIETIKKNLRPSPGAPSRVLVVDDASEMRGLLGETLQAAGLLPVLAANGQEALEWLARGPIAVAVVDLLMPQMSGLELLLRLQENPALQQLPVVVLTEGVSVNDDLAVLSGQTNTVFLRGSPRGDSFSSSLLSYLRRPS